jgi:hypothetical protein
MKQMALDEPISGPMLRATPTAVEVAQTAAGYTFEGVASTIGHVDRMNRCFLPGAFGTAAVKTPLLAYHDDTQPIGATVFTPRGVKLTHKSKLSRTKLHDEIEALIQDGGIPATSIGWLTPEQDRYYGWAALERRNPELAKLSIAAGVPQRDDVVYYASAELVENSVVPIPAHRGALIAIASLMSTERGMVDAMLELSAGARHSSADQSAIQRAHDALAEAGAICRDTGDTTPQDPGEGASGEPVARTGITGGWFESMRAAVTAADRAAQIAAELLTAADKPAYAMPDGSYPINTCADVSDAAGLAHHSTKYSFEEIRAHVMRAKDGLNCPDSVLPDSWGAEAAKAALEALAIDDLARDLAALKAR